MKRPFTTSIVVLMLTAFASAQLAVSHGPTAASQQSSPGVAPRAADRPVARVNGTVLTNRDLVREMYAIFPYARQHNGAFPKAMEAEIRKGALKMIVFEELAYQEALRRGLTVQPAKMEQALAAFRKQFKNPDEFREFMQVECKNSQRVLRAKIQRSLLIDQLLDAEVSNRAVISFAQARAYYDQNQEEFRIPESFAIQTISILPPEKATSGQLKALRKRAEEALRQAKATKNYEEFGVLAEKISEDDYRVMMGDRHAVDQTRMPPEVLQAAQALQPGQVSDLIPIEQGYTVIRLNAHNPAGMQKFVDVKEGLRKQLKQQKSEQLRSALDKKLRTGAKVEEL
jgi:peptidyl-prolyl cis-trans isomerase SurA